jgi:hypothetical protein
LGALARKTAGDGLAAKQGRELAGAIIAAADEIDSLDS